MGASRRGDESLVSFRQRTERRILTRLGTGFLVLIPLAITIVVFRFLYSSLEDLMRPLVIGLFGEPIPAVGFVASLVLLYILGLIATNVLGKRLINILHSILGNIPMVQTVYRIAKQATDALAINKETGGFKRVVLVEYPRKGIIAIGFVTGQLVDANGKQIFTVYIPTAPNPTSGHLAMIPESQVTPTDLRVDTVTKLIISGGSLIPEELNHLMGKRQLPE